MSLKKVTFIVGILTCCISITMAKQGLEKSILDEILENDDYDSGIRPKGINGTGPAVVQTNLYIRSIDNIDPIKMEFSTQVTFRMQWHDDRLIYDDKGGRLKYVTLTDSSKIWKPDIFFTNEKSGHFHDIIMPNILLRIFPNGDVLYSIRLSLTLSCPMDLSRFPFDSQRCSIRFSSYGYTSEDLVLHWDADEPVQITRNWHLPHMTLTEFESDYCIDKTGTGDYSCLMVHTYFRREKAHYISTIFLPFIYLTALALSTFWFKPTSATLRVGLCLGIILIMNVKMNRVSSNIPEVSYKRAIDEWNSVCVWLVVAAIAECGLVQYLLQREERQAAATGANVEVIRLEPLVDIEKRLNGAKAGRSLSTDDIEFSISRPWSGKVDLVSRFLFPAIFVIFNVVYWSKYGGTKTTSEE